MKLSIENFKSISALHNFDIKPFTILSGKNSSGKSSFIQLLLILKQTIEKSSTEDVFEVNGELYKGDYFSNLIYKNEKNISFSFSFDRNDFSNSKDPLLVLAKQVEIAVSLFEKDKRSKIESFDIKIHLQDGGEKYFSMTKNGNDNYTIKDYYNTFIENIGKEQVNNAKIEFVAFFPKSFSFTEKDGGENKINIQKFIKIDRVKKLINEFLKNISYLGPDRESPKSEYSKSNQEDTVGIKGEFTAQILQSKANENVLFNKIKNVSNTIEYESTTVPLSKAVKYWMCDIFGVAKNIYSEKIDDTYKIFLETENGLKINIKHVGYGISQLLPIVVEGLIMPKGGTLIIEQPEIHLHPKIQSHLFDFLYSLILQEKKVIVETHSSHFITRMRRRIAESDNKMQKIINLTFIENDVFRTIKLDYYGTLNYFPKDFIEQDSEELKAIVEAQMNKRLKGSN